MTPSGVLTSSLFCPRSALPTEAERRRYLHLIVCLLPRYNRDTMEIVFVFLKWVASFSHIDEETGSKMDLPNLSTVITLIAGTASDDNVDVGLFGSMVDRGSLSPGASGGRSDRLCW